MKNSKQGFAIPFVVIAIIAILAVVGGFYIYSTKKATNKNVETSTSQQNTKHLTKGEAFTKLVNEIKNKKLTTVSTECLFFTESDGNSLVDATNPSTIIPSQEELAKVTEPVKTAVYYEVDEKHGGNCGGTKDEAPWLFFGVVNEQGVVTIKNPTGYYLDSLDSSPWQVYKNDTYRYEIKYKSSFTVDTKPSNVDYGRKAVTFRKGNLEFKILSGPITDSNGKASYEKIRDQYINAAEIFAKEHTGDTVTVESNLFYKEGMSAVSIWDRKDDAPVSHTLLIERGSPYDYVELSVRKTDGSVFTGYDDIISGQMMVSFDLKQ